ncbi:hypothetical protein [Halobaculum limi]|uniref:hypothetical protein n=1 Tax=Halobaculum limi TaxID=3031916 RepID=UPI0024055521|nr:hypothetical protein [Halobaculum sp. YSMS11]
MTDSIDDRLSALADRVSDLEAQLATEREARREAEAAAEQARQTAHAAAREAQRAHSRLDDRAAVRMDAPDPTTLTVEPTCEANPMPLGTILSSKATHSDVNALRRVLIDSTGETPSDELSGLTPAQAAFIEAHGSVLEYLTTDQSNTTSQGTDGAVERVTHETAKLRRKLHSVVEQAGLSTSETTDAAAEQDKLNRLLKYGPSDVVDRVHKVHERAKTLLEHAGKWGRTTADKLGTRITLTGSGVKERLGLARSEQLSSTEIRRVFEKLESLASDSPRKVVADTGGRGQNRLVIYLTDAEVNRLN